LEDLLPKPGAGFFRVTKNIGSERSFKYLPAGAEGEREAGAVVGAVVLGGVVVLVAGSEVVQEFAAVSDRAPKGKCGANYNRSSESGGPGQPERIVRRAGRKTTNGGRAPARGSERDSNCANEPQVTGQLCRRESNTDVAGGVGGKGARCGW